MTRLRVATVALVVAAVPLGACSEVKEESSARYEPSKVAHVDGADIERVTFTAEGAKRVELQTALVQRSGSRTVVPYAALIYDGQGKTFVYTNPEGLSYLRAAVEVQRIEGSHVLLSQGPPAGTKVVTQGASEVYGAELGIGGGH